MAAPVPEIMDTSSILFQQTVKLIGNCSFIGPDILAPGHSFLINENVFYSILILLSTDSSTCIEAFAWS
jgi:hypothetical protein